MAIELGVDPDRLGNADAVQVLAGATVPEGAEPLAMAYAGHQFGNFVPQLGDGRALLLGEVIGRDGVRRDIQLKGSGPTPFSRRGDGRAALGPALREFIVSEAMAALGIPTTRSLAVVATGETVRRERPLQGAVLTRVARSHVRVGTFQFFRAREDVDGLRLLADHVIARQYPEVASSDPAPPGTQYRAMLEQVVARTAALIALWQSVGFIHGVMNTDNMQVAGETIDYGPLRLHGQLPSGHGLQLDRRRRSLCLWQPAADRTLEHGAPGGSHAAAAGQRPAGSGPMPPTRPLRPSRTGSRRPGTRHSGASSG